MTLTPDEVTRVRSLHDRLDMNLSGIEKIDIGRSGVAQQKWKLGSGEDDCFSALFDLQPVSDPQQFRAGLW